MLQGSYQVNQKNLSIANKTICQWCLTRDFKQAWIEFSIESNDLNIFACTIFAPFLFFIYQKEPPSSCSIFKLHPGTFSFSIISDIFQAIFINSNSYQINWENAKIHVCTEVKNKVYLFSLQLKDKCDPHGRFTTI